MRIGKIWVFALLMICLGTGVVSGQVMTFDIPAEAALLMDAETGQILFAKNEQTQLPPASLTKIMTMLLVMEAIEQGVVSLDDRVAISRHASSMGGSQVFLDTGESFTLLELLKAVAIASGNDASVAIGEHVAGTEANFVQAMNRRASQLGMTRSHFANASGLPTPEGQPDCLTTAQDVAIMSRELVTRFPEVLEWTKIWQMSFREGARPFILTNTNRLIRTYPGADGLKTGFTRAAGYCLSATAARDDQRLVSVVMRTESDQARLEQSTRLLDYGFRAFEQVFAAVGGQKAGELSLPQGRQEEISVLAQDDLKVLIPRGGRDTLQTRIERKEGLEAPVSQGEVIGELIALQEGREIARIPVVAAQDVAKANIFVRLFRWARDLITSLF